VSVAALFATGALACQPAPAHAAGSTQLVTVSAAPRATVASLELWARRGSCWRRVAGPWRARVGRAGISARKREGDGATPAGLFRLGPVGYGLDASPGWHGRWVRLRCGDWWDEDPGSATYNRFRRLPCGAQPAFGGGSEALWRMTVAYRDFLVIGYNAAPVVPGRGSAIFLHDDTGGATSGCVSLPRPRLLRLLRWLRPAAHPRIAIHA
jgi:L,D-peptidoglycan transpeptidase YkuD (ErfK/YbiS/YcfS/YnhG family)